MRRATLFGVLLAALPLWEGTAAAQQRVIFQQNRPPFQQPRPPFQYPSPGQTPYGTAPWLRPSNGREVVIPTDAQGRPVSDLSRRYGQGPVGGDGSSPANGNPAPQK
jgi:hypothetical protein